MLSAEHCSSTLSLGTILVLSLLSCLTLAADKFQWKIPNDVTTTHQLQECSTIEIELILGFGYQPIPPLSLIGYPENGIPVASPLNLQGDGSYSWEVPFPEGTTLLMQVVDSKGVSGGVSNDVYNVLEGSSTACHSNTDSPQVKLTVNTERLSACDPLLLDISGGSAPYTITIVPQKILPLTYTISQAGRFRWINDLDPSLSPFMVAAVSDSHGNYASSPGFISLAEDGNTVQCNTSPSFTPSVSTTPNRPSSTSLSSTTVGLSSSSKPTPSSNSSSSTSQSQTQSATNTSRPIVVIGSTTSATSHASAQTAEAISTNTPSKLRVIIPAIAAACLLLMGVVILFVRRRQRVSPKDKTPITPRSLIQALSAFNVPRESFIQRVPSVTPATLPPTYRRETARLSSQQSRVRSSRLDDLVTVLRRYLSTVQTPETVERLALQATDREGYNRIPETALPGIEAAPPSWESVTLRRIASVPPPVVITRTSRIVSLRASEPLPEYDIPWAR